MCQPPSRKARSALSATGNTTPTSAIMAPCAITSGKLTYTNVVAPYYKSKFKRSYYTNEKVNQPIRAWELVKEALAYHKSKGFDFGSITVDSQQYAYALNVFYAGPCINNWAKGLWPHSHHLQTRYELMPGKFAYDYQITDIGSELSL